MLIRGSVALNIFIGITLLYFFWQLTKSLKMEMTSELLGQIMGVGALALLIVFQQEVRRFLIMVGNKYFTANNKFSFEKLFSFKISQTGNLDIEAIVDACEKMGNDKTGALIVIARKMDLQAYLDIGDEINANISSSMLQTIFYKGNPLHDGAVIIQNNKIKAARCVLPISENPNLPPELGMRHRSGLGMSEVSDALVIIVSEQTGTISVALHGELMVQMDKSSLKLSLYNHITK